MVTSASSLQPTRTNYHTIPGIYKKRKLTVNQAKARIKLIKGYAQWMDAIPGLPIKIGLDGIIGLIPGVGDISTGILSLLLIYLARDLMLPKTTILKMLGNIAIDTTVGAVPLFGDIFDIMWKSNLKNTELIEKWFDENVHLFEQDEQ